MKLLLDRGADANTQQFRGQTALMWAAAEGHADVVKLLLARGADPALSSAASTKHERRPPGGMTALLFASRQGKLDAARALLDGGADIDQAGADNTSPLLIAVVNGHYDLASLLIERGANPNVADANGRTPLYAAIDLRNVQWSQAPAPELPQATHLAMITKLLDAGADPSIKMTGQVGHRGSFDMRWTDLKGGTAFSRAAWNGDIEVMRLLLARGADPKVVTEKGETALLLLAGAGLAARARLHSLRGRDHGGARLARRGARHGRERRDDGRHHARHLRGLQGRQLRRAVPRRPRRAARRERRARAAASSRGRKASRRTKGSRRGRSPRPRSSCAS